MALSPKQREVLNRVAAGDTLLSAEGEGYWFNDGQGENDVVRKVVVERLVGLGLLEREEFGLGDRAHHYAITAAGFDALGIKVVAEKPPMTAAELDDAVTRAIDEGEQEELSPDEQRALDALNELFQELERLMGEAPAPRLPSVRPPLVTPTGVDKHFTSFVYAGPGIGLLELPRMPDADEIALLGQLRSKVPEFGHRKGLFESCILEVEGDGGAILVLAHEQEDTYAAVFCQSGDQAMSMLMSYAGALGMDLDACQYFPPESKEETA